MFQRSLQFYRQFDRGIWILAGGWFVGATGFAATIPFISIYFNDKLGLSPLEIGVFFAAMAVVRSAFQGIGGELSDYVGRSVLLRSAQYARAVTFVALGLSVDFHWGFWPIAAMLALNSITGAVAMANVNSAVSDILPADQRLDGYAITRSGGNLGWAVGPAIGGLLAETSYGLLFYISAMLTVGAGLIFQFMLKLPTARHGADRFSWKDLLQLRKDTNLAIHVALLLALYLVVAQLVAPFSLYAVQFIGISEARLGLLFMINGMMVVLFQIPVTRLLSRFRLTSQLAGGALLYFVGYGLMGVYPVFWVFLVLMIVITTGELMMSPPALTVVSRLAPEGRIGRYMGVYGLFATAGWSLGPLYGGLMLDRFEGSWIAAWVLIASLALVAAFGFALFGRRLPAVYNHR